MDQILDVLTTKNFGIKSQNRLHKPKLFMKLKKCVDINWFYSEWRINVINYFAKIASSRKRININSGEDIMQVESIENASLSTINLFLKTII